MTSGPPDQLATRTIAGCDTEFLSRHSTKVVIQETATRRYLSPSGLWLGTRAGAMTFRSGSAAMDYLRRRKLTKVQFVLTRDITVSEVIPVTNAFLT